MDDEKLSKIDVAAYYIAQKQYRYDELCYLLAQKQISEKPEKLEGASGDKPEDGSGEALKFFHNWILALIDIGGPNLPKTISTRLGYKLGKVYKDRGISGVENGLTKSYDAFDGVSEITKTDQNTIEVKTTYPNSLCPLAGKYNPDNAEIIQDSICYPFTMGFLTELDPRFKYSAIVHECILKTNECVCKYTLKLEEKPK